MCALRVNEITFFHAESISFRGKPLIELFSFLLHFISVNLTDSGNCNATNLTVEAPGRVGGFIGTADGAKGSVYSGVFINAHVENAETTLKNIKSRLAYGVFLWYNIVKKKVSVLLCLTEASHVKRHHGMD